MEVLLNSDNTNNYCFIVPVSLFHSFYRQHEVFSTPLFQPWCCNADRCWSNILKTRLTRWCRITYAALTSEESRVSKWRFWVIVKSVVKWGQSGLPKYWRWREEEQRNKTKQDKRKEEEEEGWAVSSELCLESVGGWVGHHPAGECSSDGWATVELANDL